MKTSHVVVLVVASIIGIMSIIFHENIAYATGIEDIAIEHNKAFTRGDVRTAVSLTHSTALNEAKNDFIRQYEYAKSSGNEREFCDDFGLPNDIALLRSLSSKDLNIKVLENLFRKKNQNNNMAGNYFVVSVIKSENIDNNNAKVYLHYKAIKENRWPPPDEVVVLKKDEGQWKVMNIK